jgi:glucose/arabinose dehydrogenase
MLVLATPLTPIRHNSVAIAQRPTLVNSPTVNDPNLVVQKVVDGLKLPTKMAFLDKHRILVLEKDTGTVRLIVDGELQPEPLLDVAVANHNEKGLDGIAISKENRTTTYVFLYYTESGGGVDGDDNNGVAPAGNRLYRYVLQDNHLVNPKLLLDLPAQPGNATQKILGRYIGGPIVVGRDGFVYVIIGDVDGHKGQVQNFAKGSPPDGTSGVLRVGKNGEIPPSIIGTGTFAKYYYAYGIRNSFGMTMDPVTGKLWDTENGPTTGDEINLVDAGFNSGWRKISGMAPTENPRGLVLFNANCHYSNPVFSWNQTVGPTGITFLNSNTLGKQYKNSVFVGDYNHGAIYRFELNKTRTGFVLGGDLADKVANTQNETADITFGTGFGSITDLYAGPDGNLYVVSYGGGAIYKITTESASASTSSSSRSTSDNTMPPDNENNNAKVPKAPKNPDFQPPPSLKRK